MTDKNVFLSFLVQLQTNSHRLVQAFHHKQSISSGCSSVNKQVRITTLLNVNPHIWLPMRKEASRSHFCIICVQFSCQNLRVFSNWAMSGTIIWANAARHHPLSSPSHICSILEQMIAAFVSLGQVVWTPPQVWRFGSLKNKKTPKRVVS